MLFKDVLNHSSDNESGHPSSSLSHIYIRWSLQKWIDISHRACSTDPSISWHPSHSPVWCFPTIFRVLLSAQCPNLNFVNTVSTHLCPLPTLVTFTIFWIWYRCLPFPSLSHHLETFGYFFPPDYTFNLWLLILTWISIFIFFKALSANLSTNLFPLSPICAGTQRNFNWPPWLVILVTEWRTSYNISWQLLEWKELKIARAEGHSEQITTFSKLD